MFEVKKRKKTCVCLPYSRGRRQGRRRGARSLPRPSRASCPACRQWRRRAPPGVSGWCARSPASCRVRMRNDFNNNPTTNNNTAYALLFIIFKLQISQRRPAQSITCQKNNNFEEKGVGESEGKAETDNLEKGRARKLQRGDARHRPRRFRG